jgi:hypothetical protein
MDDQAATATQPEEDVWGDDSPASSPPTSDATSPTPELPDPKPTQAPTPEQQQDVWADSPSTSEDPTGLDDKSESWWSAIGDKLNKPLVGADTPVVGQGAKAIDAVLGKVVEHEIASAHPWQAQVASWYKGSMEDAAKFASSMTSPTQLAITAAGFGKGILIKGAATIANLYYAERGAKAMYDDHIAALETMENLAAGKLQGDPEALQRYLYGMAGVTMGTTGAASDVKTANAALKGRIQTKLGISGDLADQVTQKVQDAHVVRQKGAARASSIELKGAQDASDVLDTADRARAAARSTVANADLQIPIQIGQIMRDAIPTVLQEQARVSKPFEDMNSMSEEAVTDAQSLRASMMNTLKTHEIQDHEIPPKIFNALAKRGEGGEGIMAMGGEIGPGNPLYERLKAEGAIEPGTGVNFSTLTRVRDDVWDASQSAKSNRIRHALLDTLDTVTKMQEDYAIKNNFGNSNRQVTLDGQTQTRNDMYDNAKFDYMKFKRGLGNKLMQDFTKAETLHQQTMAQALSKIDSDTYGPTMRKLLGMAGVDIKPLDDLMAQKSSAQATLKEGGKSATKIAGKMVKESTSRASSVRQGTVKAVNDLGKQSPIIEGRSDFSLVGKSTEQIRREKLNAVAQNAQQKGIGNPYALALISLGALRALTSPVSGAFMAVRGVAMSSSKSMVQRTLRDPSFQDWAIREAGVHPTNIGVISKLRKAFVAMATSGSLTRAASTLAQKPEPEDDSEQ